MRFSYTYAISEMTLSKHKATMIGLLGPIFWGMSVGLTRTLAENAGITAGMAIMNSCATIYLLCIFGWPKLRSFPLMYLIFGVGAAVGSDFFFATSLAISDGGQQTIEVGMVNYLWPCMTVLGMILFNGQKARWWIVFGLITALIGIIHVISGDTGFHLSVFAAHIEKNPLSYLLAFIGAFSWAGYSVITRRNATAHNPVVIIFAVNAVIFTTLYIMGVGPRAHISWNTIGPAVATALIYGSAYAAWNTGIMKGNPMILGIASYFTPVLSCLFASFMLGASLSLNFWMGVILVVIGSFICFEATNPRPSRHHAAKTHG